MNKENPVIKAAANAAQEIIPEKKKKRHPVLKWGCLSCSTFVFLGLVILIGYGVYSAYVEDNKFGIEITESKKYTITQTHSLVNEGPIKADKIVAHLALLKDQYPYHKVINKTITPADYELVTDENNNEYAKYEFIDVPEGERIEIKAVYEVEANAFKNYYKDCVGELITTDLGAEENLESADQRIIDKANEITQGKTNICEKAWAIYNWVGDNMTYPDLMEGGGALNALTTLEGDCQYFADLFVALSRASGIPSRSITGFTYDAGPNDKINDNRHAWAEVYLPGIGWTPVDPTWGRYENSRDYHFSASDGLHMPLAIGRNYQPLENGFYFHYRYWYTGEQIAIDYNDQTNVTLVE